MPFVVSTSKSPTAVLGVITGLFLGNGETFVLVNRLNMVSLFKETDDSVQHLADFVLFASLKFMEALPLFSSKGPGRHVVFLLSAKQEASIVTFGRNSNGAIEMITLFHGGIDTCFYQGRLCEASLCASGGYRTAHDDVLPLVTFSIHRGSVFLFDAVAAIAAHGRSSKSASLALDRIFPSDYAQNVLKRPRRRTVFSQGHFNALELDVRTFVFGPIDNEKNVASLYVLYVDSSSKTHVSEYSIELAASEESCRAQKTPARPWLLETLEVSSPRNVFKRKGVLLGNVETNACLLCATSEGLFVLGPQLITFVLWKMTTNQSSTLKNVMTLAFPSFNAYVEPVCCAALPDRELLVFFWDGTYVKTALKEEVEGLNPGKMVLVNVAMSFLRTIPDSLAVLSEEHCVVGSRMTNTLWMKWRTGENGVLLNNCGPVFDMTVAADGPRMSVIASTGVGLSGGLSLERSAVNVRHDIRIESFPAVKQLCVAGDTIIFSLIGRSRVGRFQTTSSSSSPVVKEVFASPFDASEETLALFYNDALDTFVQVTSVGLNIVKNGKGRYLLREDGTGIRHAHVNTNAGLLVFSSTRVVFVFDVNALVIRERFEIEHDISSLVVLSSNRFAIGEWNSAAVGVYEIHEEGVCLRGRFTCSATPCSMCVLSHLCRPRLLVGLLNGYVFDLVVEDIVAGKASVRETFLKTQPVQLFNLESHNAVLCLGEVPLIIIVSEAGLQLTGIDFHDVVACAIIDNPRVASKYIFCSQRERALIFGNIVDIKKLNSVFLGLKFTVTRVKYIAWWNVFVLSVRHNEKDQVLLITGHGITSAVMPRDCEVSLELLENERCVFLEAVVLGGLNEFPAGDEMGQCRGNRHNNIGDNTTNNNEDGGDDHRAILIGTTFAFPDEQSSLWSRFMWCSVEQGQLATARPQLRLLGSKDVEGALQCCCIVPNYTGRIALGINGCIVVYSWNTADSVFVAEETVCVGTIITRLVPVFHKDMSCIVAFDARHSCFFVRVDMIQGSLKIVARDSEPRGVMDGVVLQSGSHHDICFGDDLFNFFCLSHDLPESSNSSDASPATPSNARLKTSAQYHLGDLVTALQQGSFAPCSVANDVVPTPNALIPGMSGSQLIFGTSHGAFGTITPVSNETYLFLKALELAVSVAIPALGGFKHASYREVLRAGQERGYSRNASFENIDEAAAVVLKQRKERYVSKRVCSGDLVQTFLTLSEIAQQQVVHDADVYIRKWYAAPKSTLDEFLEHLDFYSNSTTENDAPQDEYKVLEGVNEVFSKIGLPVLPLTQKAVSVFIQNLQRSY